MLATSCVVFEMGVKEIRVFVIDIVLFNTIRKKGWSKGIRHFIYIYVFNNVFKLTALLTAEVKSQTIVKIFQQKYVILFRTIYFDLCLDKISA